ncbi:MAG TPA: hypothetical protein VG738_18530 [Chitinophagaceae bacterium]|nr:hypothetical protein [Chitinophagaceae bacterium]
MKRRFLLLVGISLSSCSLFAQYSSSSQFRGGIQINGLQYPSSVGNYGMSFGPGIDFAYAPDNSRFEYAFNGSYYLPSASITTGYVYNSDMSSEAEATLTQKTSTIALGAGGRYFFMDREDHDLLPYATVSATLVLANTTSSWARVPQGYAPYYGDQTSGKSAQWMVNFGAGIEYVVGAYGGGAVFAEANYRFPTGTYNSRTGYSEDVQIPAHPWFSFGYRFSIGGGGW